MKKISIILLVIGILVIALGFILWFNRQVYNEELKEANPEHDINIPFEITINDTITFIEPNKSFTLRDININLCPENAMCLVADNVGIVLDINGEEVSLNTMNDYRELDWCSITFVSIKPNPLETKEILDLSDYSVVLKVNLPQPT